jgi:hypothetical protein
LGCQIVSNKAAPRYCAQPNWDEFVHDEAALQREGEWDDELQVQERQHGKDHAPGFGVETHQAAPNLSWPALRLW